MEREKQKGKREVLESDQSNSSAHRIKGKNAKKRYTQRRTMVIKGQKVVATIGVVSRGATQAGGGKSKRSEADKRRSAVLARYKI